MRRRAAVTEGVVLNRLVTIWRMIDSALGQVEL